MFGMKKKKPEVNNQEVGKTAEKIIRDIKQLPDSDLHHIMKHIIVELDQREEAGAIYG